MRLFSLTVLLFCFKSIAATCDLPPEKQDEYNESIIISYFDKYSRAAIKVEFTESIEGKKLSSTSLVSDTSNNPALFVPLRTFNEDNEIFSWMSLDENGGSNYFISASYGGLSVLDCSIDIVKEVIYK